MVWIPQDQWRTALNGKRQHDLRYDLLVDLTLEKGPFDARIIA